MKARTMWIMQVGMIMNSFVFNNNRELTFAYLKYLTSKWDLKRNQPQYFGDYKELYQQYLDLRKKCKNGK